MTKDFCHPFIFFKINEFYSFTDTSLFFFILKAFSRHDKVESKLSFAHQRSSFRHFSRNTATPSSSLEVVT